MRAGVTVLQMGRRVPLAIEEEQRRAQRRTMQRQDKSVSINEEITAAQVRLIDEKGDMVGIVDIDDALDQADDLGMDLVEISPNSDPPVCRIIEYAKWKYQQEKQEKLKKRQASKASEVKELKISARISDHDLGVKANNAKKWLEAKNRVKVTMRLRGRERANIELAQQVFDRLAKLLADAGTSEAPKAMGGTVQAFVNPKKG
ncbi:unnamed protein product [Vitrella brassicaformis CCMP3155]|uniref:Translation initiation factor IF-3 n=2 Tax=Vitrella brassicaformis TaxID=1169539 RepID=A0A0G4EYA5_VITBC|nr:unnamed protein product [Vitrella brassicaformis CCMP3155]|eukprot:CEM03425.1 unnamed protein product [Vitrella brassicaformis CCMP3155]